MDYVIETKDLVKKYSKNVVINKVSMHVPEGSIYGFVGENGSGKTTIMRLVTGLAEPTSGSYFLFGKSNKSRDIYKARKNISAIVEAASLIPTMNAKENFAFTCQYLGIKLMDEEIKQYLNLVHLENVGNKKVKNFSLGMKQRLAIAMALINKPKLLLLDEPMNGLDPQGIAELRSLLIELNTQQGITILISSHILSELEKIATTYGFILKGHLLEEISASELFNKCQNSIVIKTNDNEKTLQVLSLLNLSNYIILPNKEIKIYDDVNINELVISLDKNNINVLSMKCNEEKVEDYYLNLLKEVRFDG